MTRRAFLLAGAGLATAPLVAVDAARAALPGRSATPAQPAPLDEVRPRAAWAGELAPVGPLEVEAGGDVRFLLVHHSASANGYAPGDVPRILRAFYHHHTGTNGWPDIAYNFLVDRYGTVWEGRAGSLEQPVKGDATGGSQGFALLACLIGDHSSQPPTPEATGALVRLLGGLAQRHGIDASPGATATFVSRGSSKHPAGTVVETATIAGHRDMSVTTCPGDAAYELVTGELPARVAALHAAASGPVATPPPAGRQPRTTLPVTPDRVASSSPSRYQRLRAMVDRPR